MPRMFVALEVPLDVKRSLLPLMRGLGEVRWLDFEQQHLTLRFIGELDGGQTEEVVDALGLVTGGPLELQLKGIGHFPPRGEPRVLWAGVERNPELERLKRGIDRALTHVGLPRDERKFAPHVTLARLRRPPLPDKLGAWLMRHSLYRSEPFPVASFHLYSSWLRPDGADYQLEASYELVPGSEPPGSGAGEWRW